MKTITPADVYYHPAGIPQDIIIYQDENHGLAALVQAANDITAGHAVKFALCTGDRSPIAQEIIMIAMGKDGPRICGENGKPDGAGSYALIASWYTYCKEPAYIAAALARHFQQYPHFFRLA